MSKTKKLVFHFENAHQRDHFLTWLSESGEQEYWNWMDVREGEEDVDIRVDFQYGECFLHRDKATLDIACEVQPNPYTEEDPPDSASG